MGEVEAEHSGGEEGEVVYVAEAAVESGGEVGIESEGVGADGPGRLATEIGEGEARLVTGMGAGCAWNLPLASMSAD